MSNRKEKKATPANSGGKKREGDAREIHRLQAVILTDGFENRFRPLTLETPRCLLPLANTPLIDYTLEFLAFSGVEDVFIYASSHAEKIEEYIRGSKWNQPSSPIKNCQIIVSPTSTSVGDAMRDLDQKQVITHDFLLIHGDFIGNLSLDSVLEEHNKRRAISSKAIMTMVLREAGTAHRSKTRSETGIFVIEKGTNRCVHYEEVGTKDGDMTLLPTSLIKAHSELQIRSDLLDCSLDICAPNVPVLYTENFDYQHHRRDFLNGVLRETDLYEMSIHAHILSDQYGARARSLQTYDAISRDITSRWAYPLCPDSNLGIDQTYSLKRGNIYVEDDVSLAKSTIINRMTILGSGTRIGENTVVGQSVIGRNCAIGDEIEIECAHIWDGVTIGDGCKINNAIIANNVTLGNRCIIQPGSIISYGVKIAGGTTVRAGSRICNSSSKRNDDDSDDEKRTDEDLVGIGGIGFEYEGSDDDDDDDGLEGSLRDGLVFNMNHSNLSDSSISTISDDEDDSEDDMPGLKARLARSDSVTTAGSEDNDEAESWHKEASQSLFSAVEGDHPVEVASLELNGLRMSANASWHQVRRAVVTALVARVEQLVSKASKTIAAATETVFTRWSPLIKRTIFERKDQVDFLLIVQKECVDKKQGPALLFAICQKMFEADLVEEVSVNAWWADERSSTDVGGMANVRKVTKAFVEWLAEAEEESSEEEDSEEDDEDDEEE
ncbi:uncharacterized protein H6S33_003973 [Morchella sextelata]|uniref:uncharacterized protein n=1 Tax=Morchella sextelata TaxID=1174677 RepID=UPI001D04C11E|nr:uncharacterized protein H6S33_003973 [Morchella sextelata]KAH0606312.1 hypothetical protein H6S33_003973 [Morchella sextelata]